MKKLLSILFTVAFLQMAYAQVGSSFSTNLFLNGQAGMTHYSNINGGSFGIGAGVAVGKWIAEPLAIRIGLDVANVSTTSQIAAGDGSTKLHLFASLDALWDFWSIFGFGPQDWYVRAYPMVGIGGIFRGPDKYDTEEDTQVPYNSFQIMIGLHVPFSFSRYSTWAGFLEYKNFILPSSYDKNDGNVGMNMITLGVTKRFNQDPYHRRTAQESNGSHDDLFVGCGIGLNYSTFEPFNNPYPGGMAMIGVAPEIMIGRNYSNFWTLRLELTGISGHEPYDTLSQSSNRYMFTFLHGDLMVNLSHALSFRRGVKWNFLPYLGVGPIWRYDNLDFNIAGNLGLMVRRYINEAGDFFVDAKYIMIPPSIGGGKGPSGNIYGDGLPTITVGYIYNFGVTSTRYRLPASHSMDCVY